MVCACGGTDFGLTLLVVPFIEEEEEEEGLLLVILGSGFVEESFDFGESLVRDGVFDWEVVVVVVVEVAAGFVKMSCFMVACSGR